MSKGNGSDRSDLHQAVSGLANEVTELSKLIRELMQRQSELFLLIADCSVLGEKIDRVAERVTRLETGL